MTPNEARSEDLDWLATWHNTTTEAARRLGISVGGLRKWCARYDPDVLVRLDENERRRKGLGVAS